MRERLSSKTAGGFGAEAAACGAASQLRVQYVYFEQGNKSAALNTVLKTAKDALIVFFDDDVRSAPSTLVAYEKSANAHPEGYFFGGPMEVDYESAPPSWLIPFLPPSAKGWDCSTKATSLKHLMMGCNWAAFANDLIESGGFDETKGPGSPAGAGGQERDMQRRLIARGLQPLYVADAKVWHYVPANRCSEAWLMERRYQFGITEGLSISNGRGKILGVPNGLVRQACRHYLHLVSTRLKTDRLARFKAELRWREITGALAVPARRPS